MSEFIAHPDASPDRVEPGLALDGVVVRFYACPSGRLLAESLMPGQVGFEGVGASAILAREAVDANLGDDDHVHIGVYDGDDGERLPPLPSNVRLGLVLPVSLN